MSSRSNFNSTKMNYTGIGNSRDRYYGIERNHGTKKETIITVSEDKKNAEKIIQGLSSKEIKKLTLESVQDLLGLDQNGIISNHTILLAIANSNKELLTVLGYKPIIRGKKIIGVSKIS